MPFFSIVLPTYNRAHFVGEAVDSVLAQDEHDFELIIVDDASTDHTSDVLRALEGNRHVTVLRNRHNRERSVSRNRGIARARGLYVAFLDSDDLYARDHLRRLRDEIEMQGRPVALFYGGYRRLFLESGRTVDVAARERPDAVASVIESHIPVISVAIHRDILRDLRFSPTMRVWEDVDLFARIAARYPIRPCAGITAVWRTHGANTQHTVDAVTDAALDALNAVATRPETSVHLSPALRRRVRASLYAAQLERELARRHVRGALVAWLHLVSQLPRRGAAVARLFEIAYCLPLGNALRGLVRRTRRIRASWRGRH